MPTDVEQTAVNYHVSRQRDRLISDRQWVRSPTVESVICCGFCEGRSSLPFGVRQRTTVNGEVCKRVEHNHDEGRDACKSGEPVVLVRCSSGDTDCEKESNDGTNHRCEEPPHGSPPSYDKRKRSISCGSAQKINIYISLNEYVVNLNLVCYQISLVL